MSKVEFKFELGICAKDRVTGQTGILDMRAEYLNGCIRYSLQPQIKDDNTKRPESYWVDEQQLEFVDQGLNDDPVKKTPTGGAVESSASARI